MNEPQNRFPGEKLSFYGHSYLFTDICISVLSKRYEKLRHRLRVRLSVPVGIVNKKEGIQNPTLTAKAGQAYQEKILLLN